MSVTLKQVKDLLDFSAGSGVKDDTVQANIDRSTRIIDDVKDPAAKIAKVDDATAALSVWLTYGSYTEGITQDLGNISEAEQVKLDHFRRVAEFLINRISTEPVDLDIDDISNQSLIGIDPSITALTTSEGFNQSTI